MPISFDFKSLSKGLMHTGIPFIFKGMINEFLADRKVDIATAVGYVTGNKDLLTLFKEYGGNNFDDVIQRAHAFVDEADWLTSEYFIDSIREEHPALASLFLGWPDARTWLDIQTENLRQRFANAGKPIPAPTPTSQPAPRTTTRSADSEPSTESAELTEPPLQFDKSPTSET